MIGSPNFIYGIIQLSCGARRKALFVDLSEQCVAAIPVLAGP